MNIHYESDFKLLERRVDGVSLSAVPFTFTYYVNMCRGFHVVSYDGTSYEGCEPDGAGGLVIPFDDVRLGIGALRVRREFRVPDSDYADGHCDVVSVEDTGVVLGKGITTDVVAHVDVLASFDVPVVPDVPDDPDIPDIPDDPDVPSAEVLEGVLWLASAAVLGDVLSTSNGSVTNNVLNL